MIAIIHLEGENSLSSNLMTTANIHPLANTKGRLLHHSRSIKGGPFESNKHTRTIKLIVLVNLDPTGIKVPRRGDGMDETGPSQTFGRQFFLRQFQE